MRTRFLSYTLLLIFAALLATGCDTSQPIPKITVSVVADGLSRSYEFDEPITVGEFLREIDLQLGELDDVNPEPFTQISDEMVITVVRVQEDEYCEQRDIPYQQQTVINESIPQDSEGVLVQAGVNGKEEICYRVETRNGVRQSPVQKGDPVTVAPAQPEIIYIPPPTSLEPVEVIGTIAYLSNGNAWVMRGSSQPPNRRQITFTGDIDGRFVFSLSPDGKQLLFTRKVKPEGEFGNELWLIPDVTAAEPQAVKLRPSNVLYADWIPNSPNTIGYSRAEPRPSPPGWTARNDLWRTVIDPQTGDEISINPIIEESGGGPYGYWGTSFYWSADGQRLAYVHANAVGTVDLETGALQPLLTYEYFTTGAEWSWRSTVSWSPDNQLLLTTTHGAPPITSQPAERSPVFNLAFVSVDNGFNAEMAQRVGIWSKPQFSPLVTPNTAPFEQGYLAYFLARQPLDSVSDSAEYDLVIADRDGSNARKLFPDETQRGITIRREFTWRPDGQQLAVVYQGNLWVLDIASGIARQVTLDGTVSKPVWAQ